jgi:uncharacterized protein YjlB
MPLIEDSKSYAERLTGIGRPDEDDVTNCVRAPKANAYAFADDRETPNNPKLPLIHYRSPVRLDGDFDPAAIFEVLFASNGWKDSWRDGIYDFNHFHTQTHEVLGIVRGHAEVRFGGQRGRTLSLKAGDVIVLPAGTGHRRISASCDLLVVGAYPENGGDYDEPKPRDVDIEEARAAIKRVPLPASDPVYGHKGGVKTLWGKARKSQS